MKTLQIPALLLLLLIPCFTACGGGGGNAYSVKLQPLGGLGSGQQTYEFQVTGGTEGSSFTYQLNQGPETPVKNRNVVFTGLSDGHYELLLRARDGDQYAEDRAHWVVDNLPPAPPTLASIEVRRTNVSSAELTAFWEAPDDGSTLSYKLHYDTGVKSKITELKGAFAVEGPSPLVISQKSTNGRFAVRLTGLQPSQWYSLALEATDGNQRTTMGPVTSNHSELEDLGATYGTTSQHQKLRYGKGYTSPSAVHLGDFNGNGQVELLTVSLNRSKKIRSEFTTFRKTSRTSNSWLRNYTTPLNIYGPFGTRMYDLNLDGRQDIIGYGAPHATYGTRAYLVLAYGRTSSGFTFAYISPPFLSGYTTRFHYPVPGQFDGDGIPDIAVWVSYKKSGTPTRYEFRIYHGQGTTTRPTFTSASRGYRAYFNSTPGHDLTAIDLDGDGIDEIVTTVTDTGKKLTYHEILDPSTDKTRILRFRSTQKAESPLYHSRVVALDRDGDGDLDLLTSEYDSIRKTFHLQEWKYTPKTGLTRGQSLLKLRRPPGQILLADQGRDGIADLILHYGPVFSNLDTIAVHKGLRDPKTGLPSATFGAEELLSVSALGHGTTNRLAATDIDQDGYLDFVSHHWNRSAQNYYFAFWDSRTRRTQISGQRVVLGGAQATRVMGGEMEEASLQAQGSRDVLLGQGARDLGYLAGRRHAFKATGSFEAETRIDLDQVLPAGMEIETSKVADANGDGLSDLYYKSKKGKLGLLIASKKETVLSWTHHPLLTVSADTKIAVDRFTADERPDFFALLPNGTAQVFALIQKAGRYELAPGRQLTFKGQVSMFLVRDFNSDGFADVVAQTRSRQSKTSFWLESLFTVQASGPQVHSFEKSISLRLVSPLVSMDAGSFLLQSQKDILAVSEAGETWLHFLTKQTSSPYYGFANSTRIFTKSQLGGAPRLVQAIEFDNDGWSDIAVVSSSSKTAWLYRNNPTRSFGGFSFSRRQTLSLPFLPRRIRSLHLNDDCFVDLILGNPRSGQFAFFLGDGRLR